MFLKQKVIKAKQIHDKMKAGVSRKAEDDNCNGWIALHIGLLQYEVVTPNNDVVTYVCEQVPFIFPSIPLKFFIQKLKWFENNHFSN